MAKLGIAALLAASMLPATISPASAAGLLSVGSRPSAPAFQPAWAPNVRESDAPDPAVVRFGSTYYAYTTGTSWGNHIGVLTSTQPNAGWDTLNQGRFGSSAFPSIPPGTSVRPWQVNGSQHAPGVFFVAGRYVMFYTAQTVSGH
ncbi:MAG TPA: hypothetical protein VIK61_03710, partial [Acidimicrobiia bacterium]